MYEESQMPRPRAAIADGGREQRAHRRQATAVVAVVAWLVGVGCGLGFANLAGYDYYIPEPGTPSTRELVNENGWELVAVGEGYILRRPKPYLEW